MADRTLKGLVADLAARIARIESAQRSLARQSAQTAATPSPPAQESTTLGGLNFVFVEPVDLATGTGRSGVAWTTIDLSGDVPDGATIAILHIEAKDNGDPPITAAIEFRTDSLGVTVIGCRTEVLDSADDDVNVSCQVFAPITAARSIDYRVVGGYQDYWTIRLQGYLSN